MEYSLAVIRSRQDRDGQTVFVMGCAGPGGGAGMVECSRDGGGIVSVVYQGQVVEFLPLMGGSACIYVSIRPTGPLPFPLGVLFFLCGPFVPMPIAL